MTIRTGGAYPSPIAEMGRSLQLRIRNLHLMAAGAEFFGAGSVHGGVERENTKHANHDPHCKQREY